MLVDEYESTQAHFTLRAMTRGILANAVYLECLAFVVTTLLAASDVEAKDQARETGGVAGGVSYDIHSLCYNKE